MSKGRGIIMKLRPGDFDTDSLKSLLDHPSIGRNPGLLHAACVNLIKEIETLRLFREEWGQQLPHIDVVRELYAAQTKLAMAEDACDNVRKERDHLQSVMEDMETVQLKYINNIHQLEVRLDKIAVLPHSMGCPVLSRQHPDRDFWKDGPCNCHVSIALEKENE